MRKLSLAVIASFAALAVTTSAAGGAFDVGTPLPTLTIVKTVVGDQADAPDNWQFLVSSNCGDSIVTGNGNVEVTSVTISGGGGQVVLNVLPGGGAAVGSPIECLYTVTETAVDGWTTTPGLTQTSGAPGTLTFTNTAQATTTTSSTTTTTSTPTTTTGPTTTAITAVPTTAKPQLPATGSDTNGQLALIAGVTMLLGLGATLVARRRPAS